MLKFTLRFCLLCFVGIVGCPMALVAAETNPRKDAMTPDVWRAEHRIIDMHMHIEDKPERYRRAVRIMDAAGVGLGIELGSGTVTPGRGEFPNLKRPSRFRMPNVPAGSSTTCCWTTPVGIIQIGAKWPANESRRDIAWARRA